MELRDIRTKFSLKRTENFHGELAEEQFIKERLEEQLQRLGNEEPVACRPHQTLKIRQDPVNQQKWTCGPLALM